MSEKFRNKVNSPHRFFGKLRQMIGESKAESTTDKIRKGAGVSLSALTQFILWASKYMTVDNHLTRAMESGFANMTIGKNKKGKERKLSKFAKNNPNFTSITIWLTVWTMALSVWGYSKKENAGDKDGKSLFGWWADFRDAVHDLFVREQIINRQTVPDTFEEFKGLLKEITPYQFGFMANPEGYSRTAYHIRGEKTWTRGYGTTKHQNGQSVKEGDDLSPGEKGREEGYDDARFHLEGETYFILYCYSVVFDKMPADINKYISLNSLFYNGGQEMFEPSESPDPKKPTKNDRVRNDRWELLRRALKKGSLTKEYILELFEKYPITSMGSICSAYVNGESDIAVANAFANYLKGGPGLEQRRWAEACLYAGFIDVDNIINCPVGGLYEFKRYMETKGISLCDRSTRSINFDAAKEFKRWINEPVFAYFNRKGHFVRYDSGKAVKTTKDIMPNTVVAQIYGKKNAFEQQEKSAKAGKSSDKKDINVEEKLVAITDETQSYNELGQQAYDDGDFKTAAKHFEMAVKDSPDNALYRNNLATTYNELGQYQKAIAQARDIVRRIGNADNQYPAANYNAGVAYEKLGDYDNAIKNYELAVKRGNKTAKKALDDLNTKIQEKTAGNGSKNKTKNKETAFLDAKSKVRGTAEYPFDFQLIRGKESLG